MSESIETVKLRFFRDLAEADRKHIFSIFGISDDLLAEARTRADEVRLFRYLFAQRAKPVTGEIPPPKYCWSADGKSVTLENPEVLMAELHKCRDEADEAQALKPMLLKWWNGGMDDAEFFNGSARVLGVTSEEYASLPVKADEAQEAVYFVRNKEGRDIWLECCKDFYEVSIAVPSVFEGRILYTHAQPTAEEVTGGDANQCDGCMSGATLRVDGAHTDRHGVALMMCQKSRYRMPTEKVSTTEPDRSRPGGSAGEGVATKCTCLGEMYVNGLRVAGTVCDRCKAARQPVAEHAKRAEPAGGDAPGGDHA